MFFVLSKIFWALAQPLSLVLLLSLLALLLLLFKWRRRAGFLLVLAVLIAGFCGYTTLGQVMIAPLENRFPAPATPPARVDVVVVLGGGFDGEVSGARQVSELNLAGDRFVEAARLARLYPQARIAVSGGFGSIGQVGENDATIAARFYAGFGLSPERLILEGQSRNTAENATMIKDMLDLQPGETVLLVTSAFHMPRSVGLFRAAGIAVTPWPVDYRSTGTGVFGIDIANPVDNLTVTTVAMREWIGLLVYNLTGQIPELLPGPVVQASN